MKKTKSLIVSELLINNVFLNEDYQIFIKNDLIQFFNIESINIIYKIESILKKVLKFKIVKFNNNTKIYSIIIKLENE